MSSYFEAVQAIVDDRRGDLIKTIGDGVMLSFVEPTDAMRAIMDIQHAVIDLNEGRPAEEHMHMRTGAHYARVILKMNAGELEDVFGNGVGTAARLESRAKIDNILISADLRDAAGVPEVITANKCNTQTEYMKLKSVTNRMSVIHIAPKETSSNVVPLGA